MKRKLLKFLGYSVFTLVCLITLAVLILTAEKFRTKRAWERYRTTAVAQGQKIDFAEFIPPPVADAQNFAMTPLLKPLFGADSEYPRELKKRLELATADQTPIPSLGSLEQGKRVELAEWATYLGTPDVLEALKRFEPELAEISRAARLPAARFPLEYDKGIAMSLPHGGVLMSLAKILKLRALALLAQGKTDLALEDTETIFRLGEHLKDEPLMISQLIRMAIVPSGLQVVWEGCLAGQWSDAQLARLQILVEKIDCVTPGLRALEAEPAAFNTTVQGLLNGGAQDLRTMFSIPEFPTHSGNLGLGGCFLYGNLLSYNQMYEALDLPAAINPGERCFFPIRVQEQMRVQSNSGFGPYKMLARMMLPGVIPVFSRVAFTQGLLQQSSIGCALERFRLKQGEYPEKLQELVPQYLVETPRDVIEGQPFHYQRTGTRTMRLYSVGWNLIDDGGRVALKEAGHTIDLLKGDWVWQ